MVGCLHIREQAPGSIIQRMLNIISKPKVESGVLEAFGSEFVSIVADAGAKGPHWEEIRRQAAAHVDLLLLPEDLEPPEALGISQPAFPAFEREVLLRTCCALIDQSRMPMYRRVLGLVDPDAAYTDFLDRLLRHFTTVRVVTNNLERYELEAERMMDRYGAPVLVGDSPGLLGECVLILAPKGFTPPADLRINCPVLGEGQPTGTRTDVFSALRVVPTGRDALLIPPGISPHRFAGALYEHGGVEIGGLVAGRLLYNLKQANLSEAVYAMLRSAGYPAGL